MMDNKDFYPTPDEVIHKMLTPYIHAISVSRQGVRPYGFNSKKPINILEPSAGKGNIIDWMQKNINIRRNDKMYTIEKDEDLQYTLKGKGYRLIESDFLQYQGDYRFDLIVMNPPFSEGDKHLMKAWETIRNGDIVCLLNFETINNPYSKPRKLLCDIIEEHGEYEYLGNVFSESERETDVDVVLVRLYKRGQSADFDFEFTPAGEETRYEFNDETVRDTLAFNNVTDNILRQYEKTKEAFVDYVKARKKLGFYSQGLVHSTRKVDDLANECYNPDDLNNSYNNFIDEFKFHAWKNILNKLNIEKYLTQKKFDNFQAFAKEQGSVDLTKENIRQLVTMLVTNQGKIMEDAIIEVFDLFTKYHKENRIHVEGWKTNDYWKVNKKVILPGYIKMNFNGRFDTNFHFMREFEDIDKVMSYLSGKDYNEIYKVADGVQDYEIGRTDKLETEFFEIRCYKKGTVHLYFRDEWLWAEFNQRAVKGKNWLGGGG